MGHPFNLDHIDVVIANAGAAKGFRSVLSTPIEDIRDDFETNTLGTIKLFQATHRLLSNGREPQFVFISSIVGSIRKQFSHTTSYGISKAAANYAIRQIHIEQSRIIAYAIHPGYVISI